MDMLILKPAHHSHTDSNDSNYSNERDDYNDSITVANIIKLVMIAPLLMLRYIVLQYIIYDF